jgi:hypothetical protein
MSLSRRALVRAVFAFLVTALACLPAAATFHLWSMDELYSNADGSVQFLEMTALAPSQQFLSGHTLTVTQGSTVHTFNVTSTLPGDSAGHRMIFGTQSFANLGIVRPDIIAPASTRRSTSPAKPARSPPRRAPAARATTRASGTGARSRRAGA